MKNLSFVIAFVILLFTTSCTNKKADDSSAADSTKKVVDTTAFFPIKDFLQERINEIDSTPYFLYQITVKNGKRDSSVINPRIFDSLAKPFLAYNISDPSVKKFYKESIFQDNSTNSYTISYATSNDSLPVQNVDILLSTDNNLVKRIFLNVFRDAPDSSEMIKMGWKNNSNFYINRSVSYSNGKHVDEQNMVVWDNSK